MNFKSTYKIILHCNKCNKRIETYYDEDGELAGNFIAHDCLWSEILDHPVIYIKSGVICYQCITK